MFGSPLSWYIITLALFDFVVQTHLTAHDSSHGFITNSQKYLEDDFSSIHEEITSGLRSGAIGDSLSYHIKFDPSTLDFMQRPLGVPHLKKVTLYNFDANKSIDMTSISGSTVHFHSSFFEDKNIPPMGNTTFNVVFLGREEGFMESSLFIHTTNGHFKYDVKGVSVYSPYRLRPIVGIKLPLNASFLPLIYLHNPHMESIQIVEVYTSGGDFHLELPSGEREGPKDMWEIPPLETKAVIRVKFVAKVVQNHTAYVRIKLNNTDEVLVVPMEIEVSPNAGLYHPQGSIDFGVGGSMDAPKKLNLCVFNPFTKPIRIHHVGTTSKAVKIEYENHKLLPNQKGGNAKCMDIGFLILDWKTAFQTKDYSGKIVVKYRNGKGKTEIPYYLTVLEGGISYDPQVTKYFINDKSKSLSPRTFRIRNDFLSSLRLLNVTLPVDAQKYFSIENFKPIVLKSQEENDVFKIKYKNLDLKVNFHILLHTNISNFAIPLLSYDGKLDLQLPYKSKDYSLDLGLMSFDSKKEISFLVHNKNPVGVTVKGLRSSIPLTTAEIVGCGKEDFDIALLQVSLERSLYKCSHLKSDEYAVIKLILQTKHNEERTWGDVQIETPFENLSVPIQFKVAAGKLEIGPDRLVFDQCFPSKICSHPLRVHSTYNEPMIIEDIISLPPDVRLSCKHSGHILAHTTKVIGHLYLDPNLGCNNECYAGLHQDTSAQWLKTFSLPKSVADFDLNLVNVFYNRYLNQTSNGLKKWQNLTLRLDTSEVRGHIFKTRVKMSWPSLLVDANLENRSGLTFPLTQIGNVSYQNITIRNPSSYNLLVQIVMDVNYPGVQLLYEGLPPNILPGSWQHTQKHGFNFRDDVQNQYRHFVNTVNAANVNFNSIPVLLKPMENYTFTVSFKADHTEPMSALIFLRNNLTILEVIRLNGQSSFPSFRFGNRKPGAIQPLAFELTEKHLKECERDRPGRQNSPQITVKRSFTARNTGDVAIYVNGFYINDLPCEGYGFRVFNCMPFVLPPNGTKKIDIGFTPDFTLTKVRRSLILETSLHTLVSYTLQTTIPTKYLNLCSNLITRPVWELYLGNWTACIMVGILFFVIFVAVLDADKINRQTIGELMLSSVPANQPILDLRMVGQQTRNEIRSSKTENSIEQNKCEHKNDLKSAPKTNNETYKPKIEVEKVSALIPTTGKGRKKLTKRNSNETSEFAEIPRKPTETMKTTGRIHNTKCTETRTEEKKCTNFTAKENKKSTHQTKRIVKTLNVACEEETSSTTTESGSNVDETDHKESDHRYSKTCAKKSSSKCENTNNNGEEATTTCNNKTIAATVAQQHKQERKKSNSKTNSFKSSVKDNPDNNKSEPAATVKWHDNAKRNARQPKERRDKQGLSKKLSSADKIHNKSQQENPNNFRTSPSFGGSAVWGENRATFSDVVAREPVNNVIRPPAVTVAAATVAAATAATVVVPSNKPTLYVEPYQQTTTVLGPIGSKPFDFCCRDADGFGQNATGDSLISNSLFSNLQHIPPRPESPLLYDFVQSSDWQSEPIPGSTSVENTSGGASEMMQDPWNRNLLNSSDYWNCLDTDITQTNRFLWGSSSIWEPLTPAELPRTPTRTPPGFEQRNNDEQMLQEQRDETYYSFTSSSSSNFWR